ncbi:unnamed protein product [Nyctereutes procyonoides]|uniref:ubiquitinyl hydrolase 1 n=1 Tax=Nyctereutes procyonoides TaxID=34880 RepID=A0A811ZIY5_NYCPR|nr:unnamed protein product [Nyctereutes procyonoides]
MNICHSKCVIELYHQDVHSGEMLSKFKEFSQSFDAVIKGLALGSSDVIQQVHNSFVRQQMFETFKTSAKEDAFHFVSYVPKDRLVSVPAIKMASVRPVIGTKETKTRQLIEEPMDTDQGNRLNAIQSEVTQKRQHNYLPFIMESLNTLKRQKKNNAKKAQETIKYKEL